MIINWGDAPFKAFITVTYPSGTLKLTNGNETFSHSGGGTITFTVKKRGTWTATATDTNASATAQFTPKTNGEQLSKTLRYELILFDGGAKVPWVARATSVAASVGSTLYVAAEHSKLAVHSTIGTTNKIDVTSYKTLYFTVTEQQNRGWYGVSSATDPVPNYMADTPWSSPAYTYGDNKTGTFSVNIANVSGSYYVFMGVSAFAFGCVRVSKVWMTS